MFNLNNLERSLQGVQIEQFKDDLFLTNVRLSSLNLNAAQAETSAHLK